MTRKLIKIISIFLIFTFVISTVTIVPSAEEQAPWNDDYTWNDWYPNIDIPEDPTLQMYVTDGKESYFDIEIKGIYEASDLSNGTYNGWCFQKDIQMTRDKWFYINMTHSYDPNKLDEYKNANWDIINYIINNKHGASKEQIQDAIWYFMEGYKPTTTKSQEIISDAQTYGCNFCPQPGQKIAVILDAIDTGIDADDVQRTFIEVYLGYYEGKDPYYWRCHTDLWGDPGEGCCDFSEDTFMSEIFSVFPVGSAVGSKTLFDALGWCTFFPRDILLREAVAGLINSCNSNITYPLRCDQIVDAINFEFGNNPSSAWGYRMLRLIGILYFYNRLDTFP